MHKYLILLVYCLMFSNYLIAQNWITPVQVTQTNSFDENPDFCIDYNGTIHCVWSHKIAENNRPIMYSKSTDNGLTWSWPFQVSEPVQYWMDDPRIVCDSQNNLHVTYEYQIGNEQIHYKKFNGQYWESAINLSGTYNGSLNSGLVVDHNDRVYAFWYWSGLYGEFYYRYIESGELSGILSPFHSDNEMFAVLEAVADTLDNLHCAGCYRPSDMDNSQIISYYFYNFTENQWSNPVLLGSNVSGSGYAIALDNAANPRMLWREYSIYPTVYGTFYSLFDGMDWSTPLMLTSNSLEQTMAIDYYNLVHFVQREDTGPGNNLVYYTYRDSLSEGYLIDTCSDNFVGKPKIRIYNNQLYLIYLKYSIDRINVFFTKMDITSDVNDHLTAQPISNSIIKMENYPNPFSTSTTIDFHLRKTCHTTLQVFNIRGQLVRSLINDVKSIGEHSVIWDGRDEQNIVVSSGIYYCRISAENDSESRMIIRIR